VEGGSSKIRKFKKGQSLVEYLILFTILVGLSLILANNAPSFFRSYVSTATDKMK